MINARCPGAKLRDLKLQDPKVRNQDLSLTPTTMSSPLRIGVLLVGTVQLLDLSAVDLLYMTTPEYLQECSLPQPLVDLGRPCEIHYIAHNGPNDTAKTTAQMSLQVTDSLTDSAVSPGKLDIVVIPGPPPKAMPPPEEYLDFVRAHFAAGAPILSICTGSYVIGHAGITKGREVTAPRLLIPEMRRKFPEAKLWDDSVRIARDGNLWTSGMFFFPFFFLSFSFRLCFSLINGCGYA